MGGGAKNKFGRQLPSMSRACDTVCIVCKKVKLTFKDVKNVKREKIKKFDQKMIVVCVSLRSSEK